MTNDGKWYDKAYHKGQSIDIKVLEVLLAILNEDGNKDLNIKFEAAMSSSSRLGDCFGKKISEGKRIFVADLPREEEIMSTQPGFIITPRSVEVLIRNLFILSPELERKTIETIVIIRSSLTQIQSELFQKDYLEPYMMFNENLNW